MTSHDSDLGIIGVASRLLGMVLDLSTKKQLELLALMDQWKHDGARRHSRRDWKVTVACRTEDQELRALIKDISDGGVFIETKTPFAVGQELNLTFPLPDNRKVVKVDGEIVWISTQGIGVKFRRDKPYE